MLQAVSVKTLPQPTAAEGAADITLAEMVVAVLFGLGILSNGSLCTDR
jgi:hypothetical protein